MAVNGTSGEPIVSPSLIKWNPVFIEQFDLGIGEEWLPRVGVGTDETIDEPSEELAELTSDVTQWLSGLPDVGSIMDCDDGDSSSFGKSVQLDAIKNTDTASDGWSYNRVDNVVKPPPKQLKLSLASSRRKSKITERETLTTSAPLKDCNNQLHSDWTPIGILIFNINRRCLQWHFMTSQNKVEQVMWGLCTENL